MFVAENSGIVTEDLEKLFYNGFDNPESFGLVRQEDLKQLQIEEDTSLVFDKIQATMEVWKEYTEGGGMNGNNVYTIPEDANEVNATIDQSASKLPPPKLPKDARVLTRDLLLGKMLSKPKQVGWQA